MKALVIDDSRLSRVMIAKELAQFGFQEIVEAEDGIVALEKIDLGRYDLITLDLVMPRKGGIEVLKYIRCKNPETPVIICTSSNYSEFEQEIGDVWCIKKPFSSDELLQVLAKQGLGSKVIA
ncbi:MAG: response regulator [Negativicutes bacterium]|nr:response regulator [Negativicutes bacterium]